MTLRTDRHGLAVDARLAAFVDGRALPGSRVDPDRFWAALAEALRALSPRNEALLARRAALQARIDARHAERRGQPQDPAAEEAFLRAIGYLVPEGPDFTIATGPTDPEVAALAGPQLVVPATNARFALNAANARWGSLYDALYGTDAMGDAPPPGSYDPARGAAVAAWVKRHLDAAAPLAGASWTEATGLAVEDGRLVAATGPGGHHRTGLAEPDQLAGWKTDDLAEVQVFLRANGLLIELLTDRRTPVGATDPMGLSDVRVEAALSTIVDLEDSVACVDGADKALAYSTWLGLMRGDLAETFRKGAGTVTRRLNPDPGPYAAPGGRGLVPRARALLMVRTVGHLMRTPAVLDAEGREVFEGILDAFVTVLCALHDLRRAEGPRNSATGSVYLVKPKMHGPDEVAFACAILDRVETALDLPAGTVKLGLMDEERRTSANLKECIRAAADRIAFVNTGFLDRTGDEIHTGMAAGPMVRKAAMRDSRWIRAYEDGNVDTALACGFAGRAQVGKGMWAAPDRMAAMLKEKIAHPEAGASCAWVPSPTAAVLHATHYHRVDVAARQRAIAAGGRRAALGDLLALPLADRVNWSPAAVQAELDNNAQGILGYVVRWVDQGIGCSKVPDIDDVALMEDRATCRISAQGIANWLRHGVVTHAQVTETMRRMAAVVDRQNAGDPAYRPMAPGFDGPAFRAACALVLEGAAQPSGYTEPILHAARLAAKAGA